MQDSQDGDSVKCDSDDTTMEEQYGFKPEYSPSAPGHDNPHVFPPTFPMPQNPSDHPFPTAQPPGQNPDSVYPPLSQPFPVSSSTSFSSPPSSHQFNQGTAYRWVDSSVDYGTVPSSAVQGGVDIDGHPIYVGRAFHEGDLIPAKVIPGKNIAYVAHDGEEHPIEEYQILCQQRFEWVPSHAGHLPPGAVQGGHTSEGEPLYIGRVYHEGAQTIGKVHPSHGVCYIPFDGKEIACPQYETLILRC